MCGISGAISKARLSDELKNAVRLMSAAQIHRGPDGAGEFVAENVALGMRRLSIIDRETAQQPLYNEDKSLVLIVNGEIYNYLELREQLKKRGHEFRTGGDGEVILHLYEEDQTNFLSHLRGMFAFALWDVRRQKLVLARDRMGEKPLYLYETDGRILFASEMKSLLASGCVPFALDERAVNLYFHYQYVPEPLTAVKGVRKLDAARMLVIDVKEWRTEEKTYWKLEDAPPIKGDAPEIIRHSLAEVSRLIVRSDVPVGVALSGGLDSSIVAALAAKQQPNLHAFSVGYAGRPESDERFEAEKLARYLKIPFYDVELDTSKIVEFFPKLNFWRDDPIADIAGFGYYAVMKLARRHNVPVMLQGQGGDELFWGYPQMRDALKATRKKAALLKNPFFQGIWQSLSSGRQTVSEHLKNPSRLVLFDASPDFVSARQQMRKFYADEFVSHLSENEADAFFTGENLWNDLETSITALACSTYLRENGIAQGDRLGMASSIEMRLPLADYRFAETVIGLRKNKSDTPLAPKLWLREAARSVLPDWALNRPKRGFAPPTRDWHTAIFAAHGDSLRGGFLVQNGILSEHGAEHLAAGDFPADATCPLSFKALVLEQWCRQMASINSNISRQNLNNF